MKTLKALKVVWFIVCFSLAIFVCGYIMLFQGIVNVIEALQVEPVNSTSIAINIIKVLFTGVVLFLFAICYIVINGCINHLIFNKQFPELKKFADENLKNLKTPCKG